MADALGVSAQAARDIRMTQRLFDAEEDRLGREQTLLRPHGFAEGVAAMLGGVPLMLGTGTGSEIRQPLGYAMVGGLIVSQALTLFTTPVVYLYLDRLSLWFQGRRGAAETHAGAAPSLALTSCQTPQTADTTIAAPAQQAFSRE